MDTNPPSPTPAAPPAPPASSAPPAPSAPAAGEDKTVAIIAYLTLFGFIAAVVIHSNKKTALGAYHLRQALGLLLGGIALSMIGWIPILGWLVLIVGMIFFFVLWVIGLINAINGQAKPVPLLGSLFQQWFGTTFD